METNTISSQVQKLIAAGNVEPAVKLLLTEFEATNPKLYQQTLLLSNKYANLQQEKRLGLSPSHNENEIVLALIELATQKSTILREDKSFKNTPTTLKANRSLLIGGIALLIIVVVLLFLFNPFKVAKNDTPAGIETVQTEQNLVNQIIKACSDNSNILIFSSQPTNNNDNTTPNTVKILQLLQQQQCNANLGTHYIDPKINSSEIKYFDLQHKERAEHLSQYIQQELGFRFKTLYVPFQAEWVGSPKDINICLLD